MKREDLEKLGWEFKKDVWSHYHNNDTYSSFLFKSPRMENFALCLSEDNLEEREVVAMAWNSFNKVKETYESHLYGALLRHYKSNKNSSEIPNYDFVEID